MLEKIGKPKLISLAWDGQRIVENYIERQKATRELADLGEYMKNYDEYERELQKYTE